MIEKKKLLVYVLQSVKKPANLSKVACFCSPVINDVIKKEMRKQLDARKSNLHHLLLLVLEKNNVFYVAAR